MKRAPHQQGFTLVEIIIVVAVLAMLLAAVAPEMGVWMHNIRIRSTAEAMQNGLQQARAEAMRRNRNVQFSLVDEISSSCALSANGTSWVISIDSPEGKCDQAPSTTSSPRIVATRSSQELSNSDSVKAKAAQVISANSAATVTFNGFGRVVGTTGITFLTINTTRTGGTYRSFQIRVSSAGNVRLCDPLVTNLTDPRRC